jgi:hypothetical protein
MIHGIFGPNTHIGFVFGRDVVIILDVGCGLLGHYTEVLYGMAPVNQW